MPECKKLYHGSRCAGVLNELNPSFPSQEKNGILDLWLFATHRLDQAMLFATPMSRGGSFLTTLDGRSDGSSLVFFANETASDLFSRPVRGRVYELPPSGFQRVIGRDGIPLREWVRAGKLEIPVQTPLVISSYQQVMQAGVQILTLHPNAPKKYLADDLPQENTADVLGRVLAQPNSPLVWQNQVHNAGTDKAILKALQTAVKQLRRRRGGYPQP